MIMVRQAVLLAVVSAVFGLGVNLFSPNKVPVIGAYRDLHEGDGPIVPPTAEPNDPPFIDINVAQMEHSLGKALFVDARDSAEYVCGTIPGAINMPFEALPEGDLGPYFESVLKVAKDAPLIVFCSGEECDLSLHLARNLKVKGYERVSIFFGGAREWEKFQLPVERRQPCGE